MHVHGALLVGGFVAGSWSGSSAMLPAATGLPVRGSEEVKAPLKGLGLEVYMWRVALRDLKF